MKTLPNGSDGRSDSAKDKLVSLKTPLNKPFESTKIKGKRLKNQENIQY